MAQVANLEHNGIDLWLRSKYWLFVIVRPKCSGMLLGECSRNALRGVFLKWWQASFNCKFVLTNK